VDDCDKSAFNHMLQSETAISSLNRGIRFIQHVDLLFPFLESICSADSTRVFVQMIRDCGQKLSLLFHPEPFLFSEDDG
jgi:hypothetical protein